MTLTTLHLPISRRWFVLIAVGDKKVEYRTCSPHWQSRIDGKNITHIRLVNGYGAGRPWMLVQVRGIEQVYRSPRPVDPDGPHPEAPTGMVYAITLGEIIDRGNFDLRALFFARIIARYDALPPLVSDAIGPRDGDYYRFEARGG